MKKTKSGNRRYSKTLKRKVAQEYLSGKFSYAVAAEEYGLRDKDVVKEFVKWYRKNGYLEMMKDTDVVATKPSFEDKVLNAKLASLESKLAATELKVASLETLIDVAEKELNIEIRKKSGIKQ